MASSEVEIYNLALNATGARNDVSATDESSREASVCSLWYNLVRDTVLAAARWPEATKFDYLGLLSQASGDTWASGDPMPGFTYAYTVPSDCLHPQYLDSYYRFDVTQYSDTVKALHTNESNAILFYTFRQANVGMWSTSLQLAIAYGLAANICMPLTGKATRARMLLEQANMNIMQAREVAANTADNQIDSLPDWISARGYSNSTGVERYFYPYGALLSIYSAQ